MEQSILLGSSAFIISFCVAPLVIFLAKRARIVTDSSSKSHPAHTHTGVLPRAGGIPIFFGILLPLIAYMLKNEIVFFILLGGAITVLVGLFDDKYNLSPYTRFLLNIVAAGIAVLGGIGIPFITGPFHSVIRLDQFVYTLVVGNWSIKLLWLADIAAVLWIVWCMNMVNWSKGVDGQLPGFVAIAALFLGLLAFRFTRHDISKETVALMSFVTMGAYAGFLPWNFYPQKILPGYGAGSLAGYMLAVLSILSWGKLGTILLVLALPLTDATLVFIRRVLNKKSPFRADRSHFHHTLLELGWGRKRIAIFYWAISFIVGFVSFTMSSTSKIFMLILVVCALSGIILWTFRLREQTPRTCPRK